MYDASQCAVPFTLIPKSVTTMLPSCRHVIKETCNCWDLDCHLPIRFSWWNLCSKFFRLFSCPWAFQQLIDSIPQSFVTITQPLRLISDKRWPMNLDFLQVFHIRSSRTPSHRHWAKVIFLRKNIGQQSSIMAFFRESTDFHVQKFCPHESPWKRYRLALEFWQFCIVPARSLFPEKKSLPSILISSTMTKIVVVSQQFSEDGDRFGREF